MSKSLSASKTTFKFFVYVVCIILTILSIFPFWTMIVNATRSTYQIQSHAVSIIPSKFLMNNWKILNGKQFNAMQGFINSLIIAVGATVCAVYFSTLTAYSIVVYDWKLKRTFFTFIMAIMMIPSQIVTIGFYQMIYKVHLTNNFLPLIIPAIAAPSTVFFMRQYMIPSLSLEIIESARIDGAKEFYTFNTIALPIMKPAIATQAIFIFVSKWNELFMPLVLLTKHDHYTMPIMVSLLRGDIYRTEFGGIYLGIAISLIPIIIFYAIMSRYIIAGITMGSVKE